MRSLRCAFCQNNNRKVHYVLDKNGVDYAICQECMDTVDLNNFELQLGIPMLRHGGIPFTWDNDDENKLNGKED